MSPETSVGHEHSGKVPPGVILGRKADAPVPKLPKVDLSARTERIEYGVDSARDQALADFEKEIKKAFTSVTVTKNMGAEIEGIRADFKRTVDEEAARLDHTLPRMAVLDGYKTSLEAAKSRAVGRAKIIADAFWEKFEG
jgi:hypothetical protein